MKTQFIRNFIKLTESKNFSKLAKEINTSQSTLSNQISQLEKELDVDLIKRSTRTFKLTESGESFLKYAIEIINLIDTCMMELQEYKKDQSEEIIISASTLPGSHVLPKYIARFKEDNPNAKFKVIINNSQKSINRLKEKSADFAGIGSFMNTDLEEYDYIILETDELVFISSPNTDLISGKELVSFEELIKHPFISREKGSGTRNVIEKFPGYEQLNTRLEINDNESIITAVSDSSYISILSKKIAENAEKAGLIKILKVEEYPIIAQRKIFLLKPKKRDLTRLKKAFWDYIKLLV